MEDHCSREMAWPWVDDKSFSTIVDHAILDGLYARLGHEELTS